MPISAAQTDAPPLADRLAALSIRPLPPALLLTATRHLGDWIGSAVAGAATPQGAAFARYAALRPTGRIACLASSPRDPETAAFVNAACAIVLEMDDLHRASIVHPSSTVVPAVLAVAEALEASGPELLHAIIKGYEIAIRVGSGLGRGHYKFWHPSSTAGVFGATAAIASLHRLDTASTANALNHAATQAAGLWQCRLEPSMSKQLYVGRAIQSAILAVDAARAGIVAAPHAIDGPLGFLAALCPDPVPERMVEDPEAWKIGDVSLKPWPACRHTHAAIDATREIGRQIDLEALYDGAIERIEVATYAEAIGFCDRPEPTDPVSAKFSLQHAVAVALMRDDLWLDEFDMGTVAEPHIAALRARVSVAADPAWSARFPAHYGAAVTAILKDGRRIQVERLDASGDPEHKLTDAECAAKLRRLCLAGGLAGDRVDALAAALAALPNTGNARALFGAFHGLSKSERREAAE